MEVSISDAERTVVSQAVRLGREYIEYSDGSHWTRKVDRKTGKPCSEWVIVEAPPVTQEPDPSARYLSVVVKHQAENEPKHWCLFSHRPHPDGAGRGQLWQANGDAEYMHFEHDPDIDTLADETFAWHQVPNTNLSDAQLVKVDSIARANQTPRAVNRAAVTENCQGWVIRVLRHLVDEGIVEGRAAAMLQGHMDPVN